MGHPAGAGHDAGLHTGHHPARRAPVLPGLPPLPQVGAAVRGHLSSHLCSMPFPACTVVKESDTLQPSEFEAARLQACDPAAHDGLSQQHFMSGDRLACCGRFAVVLTPADIADLPDILASIDDEQRSRLQHGIIQYHRAFMWDEGPYWSTAGPRETPLGAGLAYNLTIASLRRALTHLRTATQLDAALLPGFGHERRQ